MKQKGASPIIPILVIAILAIGGYMYFGKKDGGMMAKKDAEKKQDVAVVTPTPAPVQAGAVVTGNPDDVIAAVAASLDEETAAADASADATLVGADVDAINSYADAYDTTNF